MKQAVITITLLAFSIGMFVPATASAAPVNAVGDPQIRVQIGRTRRYHRDRGRHRGWYNGRRAYFYTRNPYDTRYVRRSYYNNGVRVTRWYWNY